MSERVPRRLKRFYREGEKQVAQDKEEFGDYSAPRSSRRDETKDEEIVTHIPDMSYEDIDDKNLKDIKKVEQKNLEQKLATLEVKKFKKENKRLPNRKESEQLAGSLLAQFKENPVDDHGEFSYEGDGGEEISERRGRHHRSRQVEKEEKSHRHGRGRRKEKEVVAEKGISEASPPQGNIKDLMGDTTGTDGKKEDGNEFDLGLAEDMSEDVNAVNSDLDELEELADFDGKKKKKSKK